MSDADARIAKDEKPEPQPQPMPMDWLSYSVDAWQRSILFLDTMRQRSAQAEEHAQRKAPNVLSFATELIGDGRAMARPANYLLARIVPGEGIAIDAGKRPFVVIDPRAGHGPGIGGFKADSEIGVAMKAGHPCYFIGFLPDPMPGQTIEDVITAEASFIETVIARHPDADGKPCVIGNCQAGWALMMLASQRPELFGPLIIAGAPLAYWAGVHGQNPMRYSGGLMGGSWLTALTGDMGGGKFDGAWLVQNFENQNPANTLWTKPYNLYSNIDTEAERFLEFERWWGGHVSLNAEEMQFIVDELFIGNRLASGDIRTSGGSAIDLRNIRSPIVVFCSRGDNITPPQQALDWILDLYDDVDEIRGHVQTIVYMIHETAGHLGIFVSGGVARKEHDEFASNIDLIDMLPPGLYEAVLTPKSAIADHADLVTGEWAMRCEPRTLDDIRALGANDLEDERRFDAAARVSDINLALYRRLAQPYVKAAVTPQWAKAARQLHPVRLGYSMFGEHNPFLSWVEPIASQVRSERKPADARNPFFALEQAMSERIVGALESWRMFMEDLSEKSFQAIYGSHALQAALGIETASEHHPRKAAKNPMHTKLVEARIAALKNEMAEGGLTAAIARALLYVGIADGTADERRFEAIRRIRSAHPSARQMPLTAFKDLVRDQYFMLVIDEESALSGLPALLPDSPDERQAAFDLLRRVLESTGLLGKGARTRLQRIAPLFGVGDDPAQAVVPAERGPLRRAPADHALH